MDYRAQSGPQTNFLTQAIEARFDSNLTAFQGFEPGGTQYAQSGIGWVNQATGLGTARDKTIQGVFLGYSPTDMGTLSSLYHGDDLSARIIDIPGDEMMRRPFKVTVGNEGADKWLASEFKRLLARGALLDGLRWGRLFGGAWCIVGAEDGLPASEPFQAERANGVDWLRVVDRRFMWPITYYQQGPKMGTPSRYVVSQTYAGVAQGSYLIHESRMIKFGGVPTGIRERNLNASYDYSVLDRCWPQLRLFSTLWKGVELLITEGPQAVYKVKGLANKMMAGQGDAMRQRFALVDYYRSILRAVLIDSDQEEFERQPLQLAGVPDILNQAAFRISATAEVPTMVLFGQDPSGLNASGSASLRWWQDKMASKQENELGPKIEALASVLLISNGHPELVEELKVEFEPLYTLTALEEAQAFAATAGGCAALTTAQIFTPEEIAISKVQNGEWCNAWEGVRNEERVKMLDDVMQNLIAGTEPGAAPVVNGRVGQLPPDPVELLKAKAELTAPNVQGKEQDANDK